MKKITFLLIIFLFTTVSNSFAESKQIQFRLVSNNANCLKSDCDKYMFALNKGESEKEIFINKEVLLSNDDIDRVLIFKKENTASKFYPEVEVYFTKEGAAKLKEITSINLKKQFSVVVDGQVIMAPFIHDIIYSGVLRISGPMISEDEDAVQFVENLGLEAMFASDMLKMIEQQL